jgi:hypothetical protein
MPALPDFLPRISALGAAPARTTRTITRIRTAAAKNRHDFFPGA